MCDENGVLQVGQQWVLVVTLVPEKHQEPGGRQGTPELGLTRHPTREAGLTQEYRLVCKTSELVAGTCRSQGGRLKTKTMECKFNHLHHSGSISTGWALQTIHTISVKSLRMVTYKRFSQRATRWIRRHQVFQAQVCLSPKRNLPWTPVPGRA